MLSKHNSMIISNAIMVFSDGLSWHLLSKSNVIGTIYLLECSSKV